MITHRRDDDSDGSNEPEVVPPSSPLPSVSLLHWRQFPNCKLCAAWRRYSANPAFHVSRPSSLSRPDDRRRNQRIQSVKLSGELTEEQRKQGSLNGLTPPPVSSSMTALRVPVTRTRRYRRSPYPTAGVVSSVSDYRTDSNCTVTISVTTFFSNAHLLGEPAVSKDQPKVVFQQAYSNSLPLEIPDISDEPMLQITDQELAAVVEVHAQKRAEAVAKKAATEQALAEEQRVREAHAERDRERAEADRQAMMASETPEERAKREEQEWKVAKCKHRYMRIVCQFCRNQHPTDPDPTEAETLAMCLSPPVGKSIARDKGILAEYTVAATRVASARATSTPDSWGFMCRDVPMDIS